VTVRPRSLGWALAPRYGVLQSSGQDRSVSPVLIVAGGIDGQLAQQFAGGGVDDVDVQVLDQQQDVGCGVGSADADVVQAAAQAQGDAAVLVNVVVRTRSWVSAVRSVPEVALGACGVGGRGGSQPDFRHGRGPTGRPSCPETSVRHVMRHLSGIS
jgi:hypothetical protein